MKFTTIGYTKYLKGLNKRHTMFRQGDILEGLAEKSWEIAAGNISITPKAFYLPGQLERITETQFANPINIMLGGSTSHEPTRAFKLKNCWMINGSIFKDRHRFEFYPKSKLSAKMNSLPPMMIEKEIDNASIYSSYYGNEYFYNWLVDDCPMYQLAAAEGVPVTSDINVYSHASEYELALEMNPIRTNSAFLKNAIFFDDNWGNNASKHKRFSGMRNKLLSKFSGKSHPGVFILRRDSGIVRILQNELEIAKKLRDKYGFKIVDATSQSATEILTACVGAKLLIGVEGSQLTHGLMVLEPGTSVLMLQPPYRFVGAMKITADMENINYAFVVGTATEDGFYIDFEEVERTMELLPAM